MKFKILVFAISCTFCCQGIWGNIIDTSMHRQVSSGDVPTPMPTGVQNFAVCQFGDTYRHSTLVFPAFGVSFFALAIFVYLVRCICFTDEHGIMTEI